MPDECFCVGNEQFVRNVPNGDWAWAGHLPEDIARALYERIKRIG